MGRRFALALSLLGCSALSLPVLAQERIVSIGPATTELILALGGEQSLIATDISSPGRKTCHGSAITAPSPPKDPEPGADPPDRQRRDGATAGPGAVAPGRSRGGRAAHRPTLANLNQRIDTLATLLKDPAAGSRLKAEIQAQSEQLAAQAKLNKPLKVVFLLLHKGQPTSIAGGNTTASALLTLAGGVNPVAQLQDYKPVSTESLIELQPDLVLVSGRDWQQYQDPETVLSQVPALPPPRPARTGPSTPSTVTPCKGAQPHLAAAGQPDRQVDQAGFMMRLPLPWLLCLTGGALALLLVGSLATGPMALSFGESLRPCSPAKGRD